MWHSKSRAACTTRWWRAASARNSLAIATTLFRCRNEPDAPTLADADLFVSIHLNSSPDYDTTGIEVYYLNNTTDRATIRLARMENAERRRC